MLVTRKDKKKEFSWFQVIEEKHLNAKNYSKIGAICCNHTFSIMQRTMSLIGLKTREKMTKRLDYIDEHPMMSDGVRLYYPISSLIHLTSIFWQLEPSL